MSTEIAHCRIQLPVGQGFFHTGEVSLGAGAMRYIYDCGSMSLKQVHREVDTYIADQLQGTVVDSLFLSHIDYDHVSGLDRLLAPVKVRNVFLPLLTPIERLALVAHAIDQNHLTSETLMLLTDPGRWFGDRGIDRVFFVSGRTPPPEGGVVPGEPGAPPNRAGETLAVDVRRLVDKAREPFTHNSADGEQMDERAMRTAIRRRSANAKTFEIPHTLPIGVVTDGGALADWVFIPFVQPDGAAAERFRLALRKYVGKLSYNNPTRFREEVCDLVRSADNRRKLRGCYHAAEVDVNALSMSLYSGPTGSVPYDVIVEARDHRRPYLQTVHGLRCGWLGTGDSNLKQDRYRGEFVKHYQRVIERVSTMSVPHHGSVHNFHHELAAWGPEVFVVTARNGSRHHPHASVCTALAERDVIHVDEREASTFSEQFWMVSHR